MKRKAWKKVFSLVTILAMTLIISSCSEETVVMKMGETITVDDYVEFTPENVMVSQDVYPPINQNFSSGWESDSKDKVFVTVMAKVKNLSDKDISIETLCGIEVEASDETFDNHLVAMLTKQGSGLVETGKIHKGKTETVYLMTEIDKSAISDKSLAKVAFEMDAESDPVFNYHLSIDTTKKIMVSKPLKLNQGITVDEKTQLTPMKVEFTEEIVPSNPSGEYYYYRAEKDGTVLLALTTELKNLMKSGEISISKSFGFLVFSDVEEHFGTVIANDENNSNLAGNQTLAAGQTRIAYGMAEVSEGMKKKKCEVYLYIQGEYYQYTVE